MVGLSVGNDLGSLDKTQIPVICLMGTTATGKTDAAAQLYSSINSEIISVDSSLVYKGMDIGTAKPDLEFLAKYPHHLIDIRDPNDTYSVAEFYHDASELINNCIAQGKVPILAGGTMFYYNVLENGLSELPRANQDLRDKISEQAAKDGWPALHARLMTLDPQRAGNIEKNDAQRIQRALEIVLESGKVVSQQTVSKKKPIGYRLIKIALTFSDRSYLHDRIEQRFDIMLETGLQNEVEELLACGVDPNCTAMKMIGYRQMLEFLQGDITYQDMRLKGIAATRQLAKRQLTWLRNQSNVVWWVDFGLKDKKFEKLIQYVTQL